MNSSRLREPSLPAQLCGQIDVVEIIAGEIVPRQIKIVTYVPGTRYMFPRTEFYFAALIIVLLGLFFEFSAILTVRTRDDNSCIGFPWGG